MLVGMNDLRVMLGKSSILCRTYRPSTAGMEARIQTGALPAVGWSALFAVDLDSSLLRGGLLKPGYEVGQSIG